MNEEAYLALNRLLVETQMLTTLLVRTQNEARGMVKKTYCLREYLSHHKQNICRNMGIKGAANKD